MTVTGSVGAAQVTGLTASVLIVSAEPANDTLRINALGEGDAVDASNLPATSIRLSANGGVGDDVLIGGPGVDRLDGGPGDNVVIQD